MLADAEKYCQTDATNRVKRNLKFLASLDMPPINPSGTFHRRHPTQRCLRSSHRTAAHTDLDQLIVGLPIRLAHGCGSSRSCIGGVRGTAFKRATTNRGVNDAYARVMEPGDSS